MKTHFLYIGSFLSLTVCLFLSCYYRISHTYLEDDLLWTLPFISQLLENRSLWDILKAFHGDELSLFNGFHYLSMLSLFGFKLRFYVVVMFVLHSLNAALLFILLKNRLRLLLVTSALASFIYLTFYGHFHAYLWPIAMNHLFIVFSFLLLLNLYLKTDELFDAGTDYKKFYGLTFTAAFLASLTRLSVLIVPLMLLTHILFSHENSKSALRKYRLWMPVLFILPLYQLFLLVNGGTADVLDKLLDPFEGLFHGKSIIGTTFILFGTYAFVLYLFQFCLVILAKRQTDNLFAPLIKKLSYIAIVVPHYFLLCLFLWLAAIPSALGADSVSRWQPMNYPSNGYVFIVLLGICIILMGSFVRFIIKGNKSLIILLVWYLSCLPFLGLDMAALPSRYLIYISPIFCVVVPLFFIEILPAHCPFLNRQGYRKLVCLFIFLLMFVNIVAIHLRSVRTLLADYRWSYDYIKISHLITNDLRQKAKPFQEQSVCVNGLQQIPSAASWQQGFLKNFDFDRYDSFRQTFLSIYDSGNVQFKINEECMLPDQAYYVNDRTVLGKDEKSVEPFYLFFDQGLKAFRDGRYATAESFLEKAILEKPFLINFINVPEAIDGITTSDGDCKDPKINYIDTMIYHETQDYGKALLLASYLNYRKQKKEEVEELFEELSLWMAPRDILLTLDEFMLDENFKNLIKFYPWGKHVPPVVPKVETYKNCDILYCGGNYFVFPDKKAGDLDIVELKENFDQGITAASKYEIRRSIDQSSDLDNTGGESPDSWEKEGVVYKGFKIIKSGDVYSGFLEKADGQPHRSSFQSRSFFEIKIIVDEYYKL